MQTWSARTAALCSSTLDAWRRAATLGPTPNGLCVRARSRPTRAELERIGAAGQVRLVQDPDHWRIVTGKLRAARDQIWIKRWPRIA